MSIWTDTATVLSVKFTDARTDTVTTARTSTAGAFNTTTGVYAAPTETAPLSAASVLIRYGVKAAASFQSFQFGEEATRRDLYTIFLADDADIQADDRVTVDSCALDADLVGDVMIVVDVDQDSLNARKVAICELET